MSDRVSNRRWSRFSLRTLFVALTLLAALPWLAGNLYWMHERGRMAGMRVLVGLEGEKPAPWPLWVFGARGFARIHVKVPPEHVAYVQEAARDGRMHLKVLFPEAEVIVSSNAD